MNNKKIIIISASLIALILISITSYKLLNSSDSKEDNDVLERVVSHYKNGEVTLKEAQIELNKIALRNEKLEGLSFEKLTSEQKESVIKEVILKKIAYKEAKKRKLYNKQEYKDALKAFENEILAQTLYAEVAKEAATEEKVKKHYDKLAKDLEGQKDVQIRYIAVKTQEEADAIYELVSQSPSSFANQATIKSLDKESAKNGGDLGFILRSQLQPEVSDVTKTLQKGEVAEPILLNGQWIIIKLEDEKNTQVAQFEDVREALAGDLSKKALQDFISHTLEQAEISIMVK